MNADVLAIGAHPDDVELGVGGLLHKLSQRGRRVVILDLTRGEMGTRGTVEERAAEGEAAARILGAAARDTVGLPDGGLANTTEQQRRLIPFFRLYRPSVVLAHGQPDRHPDHLAAHALVRDANFFSGLARIDTGLEPYRAPAVYFYRPYYDFEMPKLIVDISEHMDAKMAALRAHASQFYNPAYGESNTLISSKAFWDGIETRAAYWGSQIGARYGEPLFSLGPIAFDLLAEPNGGP